jgi:DNA polymerase V
MYALVDCNNFYCSCERLFNPKLEGKPIVVLSNNDGCAIARSEEAKALGIVMGTPAFMIENTLRKHNVIVFSSNYTLYGDMSERVMQTISQFVPGIEIYSIDEAYLDLHNMPYADLLKLGSTIKKTVQRNTGIPVTIGIGSTKTLAKMANRFAKKHHRNTGVFWAANEHLTREMLSATPVSDICGIGHQYALLLNRSNFKTARDFQDAPEDWVRDKMSVVGLRLLYELKGIPAIKWEDARPAKKNICTSRSFGNRLTTHAAIAEAVSNYAATCALKLRNQHSCCRTINVFVQTNTHKTEEEQYMRSIDVELDRASNDSATIIKYALKGLEIIFKDGYRYMKAGVIVMDLVSEETIQSNIFSTPDKGVKKNLMAAMDRVNLTMGRDTVRMAVQGFDRKYRLRADYLSPRYTTHSDELLKIRI